MTRDPGVCFNTGLPPLASVRTPFRCRSVSSLKSRPGLVFPELGFVDRIPFSSDSMMETVCVPRGRVADGHSFCSQDCGHLAVLCLFPSQSVAACREMGRASWTVAVGFHCCVKSRRSQATFSFHPSVTGVWLLKLKPCVKWLRHPPPPKEYRDGKPIWYGLISLEMFRTFYV